MSLGTIGILVGAYVLLLFVILSVLAACKRDDRHLHRSIERQQAERARERAKEKGPRSTATSRD